MAPPHGRIQGPSLPQRRFPSDQTWTLARRRSSAARCAQKRVLFAACPLKAERCRPRQAKCRRWCPVMVTSCCLKVAFDCERMSAASIATVGLTSGSLAGFLVSCRVVNSPLSLVGLATDHCTADKVNETPSPGSFHGPFPSPATVLRVPLPRVRGVGWRVRWAATGNRRPVERKSPGSNQ